VARDHHLNLPAPHLPWEKVKRIRLTLVGDLDGNVTVLPPTQTKHERKEDLTAYLFRLYLEFARVMSHDRKAMSYDG